LVYDDLWSSVVGRNAELGRLRRSVYTEGLPEINQPDAWRTGLVLEVVEVGWINKITRRIRNFRCRKTVGPNANIRYLRLSEYG
jgi:hypothetical protein